MTISTKLQKYWNPRQRRVLREYLTAYLFILPASLIIFVFGLFPVAFAFFVSLHDWRRFPDEYLGMDNYAEALGGFGYVLFVWIGVGLLVYAGAVLWPFLRRTILAKQTEGAALLLPGVAWGVACATLIHYIFTLLIRVLDVPNRMPRGLQRDRSLFIDEFLNSFTFPEVIDGGNALLMSLILAGLTSLVLLRIRHADIIGDLLRVAGATLAIIGGVWLLWLTWQAGDAAVQAAREDGENLPIWSYIVFISLGALLLWLAFWLWQRGVQAESDRRFVLLVAGALAAAVAGYILIAELPPALAEADDDLLQGFWVTVLYVLGTVPFQLGIGLGLAYLLFHVRRGKAGFRIVYFLPYITPFAATAIVFSTFFSRRADSPINRIVGLVGIEEQKWLSEPTPINELILGTDLPQLLEGPGLALVVIMLSSTWTYIGYDVVIFMAGLGNIPNEYYEAARIDGASGWRVFRHITLPLLSPTTFFLSLIAIIGTFQAFTQIWMMRQPAADDAVDTVGVYLFETVSARTDLGYGSAMAFVLFGAILLLTIFQNRVLGRRVFYG
ncbi:MAG: ABC transporter permease subunit [Anaerolineales bacterium]